MLEKKMSSAAGMMLGVLLIAGTTAQASAQATQDTTKGAIKDTSAYSAPQPADTGAPAPAVLDTTAVKAGADTAKVWHDSTTADTSKAGKKAWKKKHKGAADSTRSR